MPFTFNNSYKKSRTFSCFNVIFTGVTSTVLPHSEKEITTASIMAKGSRKPQAHQSLSTPPAVPSRWPPWEQWKICRLTRDPSLSSCHDNKLKIRCYKVTSCEAAAGSRRASHFSLEEVQVTTHRCAGKVKWLVFMGAEGMVGETVGPLLLPCTWQIKSIVVVKCLNTHCVLMPIHVANWLCYHLTLMQYIKYSKQMPAKNKSNLYISHSLSWKPMWMRGVRGPGEALERKKINLKYKRHWIPSFQLQNTLKRSLMKF